MIGRLVVQSYASRLLRMILFFPLMMLWVAATATLAIPVFFLIDLLFGEPSKQAAAFIMLGVFFSPLLVVVWWPQSWWPRRNRY